MAHGIGITVGGLGGGEGRQGLFPRVSYTTTDQHGNRIQKEAQLDSLTRAVHLSLKEEGRHCTCSSVVLVLLGLFAVAGAAFLLAVSGGPNNLNMFLPGVALAGLSLVLTIVFLCVFSRTILQRRAMSAELIDLAGTELTLEQILSEMEKSENSVEKLGIAIASFSDDVRQRFVANVIEKYLGAERASAPLADEKKKVLSAFARFPNNLNRLPIDTIDREFAIEMITHIDPNLVQEHKELFDKLFNRANAPRTDDEFAAFARHPLVIASRLQNNLLAITGPFVQIVSKMNLLQKIEFLQKMRRDVSQVEGDPVIVETIHQAVYPCIENTLTQEYADLFNRQEGKPEPTAQETRLLAEISNWPIQAAHCIYLNPRAQLEKDRFFIEELYQTMGQPGVDITRKQEAFIKYAADQLNNSTERQKKAFVQKDVINLYASMNQELPLVTKKILAKTPDLLANVTKLVNAEARSCINCIVEMMTPDHAVLYFEILQKGSPSSFKEQMKLYLNEPRNITTVAKFLDKNPQYFQVVVGSVAADQQLNQALLILEQMNHAQQIIESLDEGKRGFVTYNLYITALNESVKEIPTAEIPEARKKLVARFKYAKQAGKKAKLGVDALKITDTDPNWTRFNEIARPFEAEIRGE